jgi:3-oxoacyl-[acyl-carrier-protein] synthase III
MLGIHAAVAYLPERVDFGAVQARERNVGYLHLLLKSAAFARPRGKGRIQGDEAARFAPSAPAALPIAPPAQSLSDLAAGAATALRARVDADVLAQTTHIVLVHATLNQAVAESIPGRLQVELGLKNVLPLAVSQVGSLGFYAALPLIEGLLAGAGQVLLVAADKWLYPWFRVFGDLVAYGDGAAAMLVRRDPARAMASVRGFAFETGPAIDDPWARTPSDLTAALVPLAVVAGRRALADAQERTGLERDAIAAVAPAGFGSAAASAVADALDLPSSRREHPGHLSSADAPAALLHEHQALRAGERKTVLLWDAALCGAAGAAVVELHGGHPL